MFTLETSNMIRMLTNDNQNIVKIANEMLDLQMCELMTTEITECTDKECTMEHSVLPVSVTELNVALDTVRENFDTFLGLVEKRALAALNEE